MGPPRPPGSHQMDSSGQMMPPPGQGYPGYPGGPYGGQQFRPQNPYAAFPPNQVSNPLNRAYLTNKGFPFFRTVNFLVLHIVVQ